jgi:serine/threonine protein kinase
MVIIEDLSIIEQKGKGISSFVYSVRHKDNTLIAKIIPKNKTFELQEIIKKEINILKYLQTNIYIVNFYDIIYENNYEIGYLMEYLPYGNLREMLDKKNVYINYFDKKRMFLNLINGLDYIHKKQVIHGDIKSLNIMIYNKTLKYVDYGTSKFFNNLNVKSTNPSLHWAAPEFLLEDVCSYRSDIYSLSMVFWEIVTLKYPFNNETDCKKVLDIIENNKIKEIHQLPSNTPIVLSYVIKKNLNYNSKKRLSLFKLKNLIKFIY